MINFVLALLVIAVFGLAVSLYRTRRHLIVLQRIQIEFNKRVLELGNRR